MFNNKVVIVTGASSGIGAAVAYLFAKEGANVAIVARNIAKLTEIGKKIEETGKKALIIQADISNDEEAETVISKTINNFGKLDILINNAGISSQGSIMDGKIVEAYDEVMKTNVRAVINLTKLAAPYLAKTKGNIINVSSAAAFRPSKEPSSSPYYISKAALDHFSRCAALELSSEGIRVNTVNPGPVDNDFFTNNGGEMSDKSEHKKIMEDFTALGYLSTNEDIGEVIMFLAGDKARSVTGSSYSIDSGILLKY
ncbi:3-oxoacyl-[acyl-carrier-protein] reductase FabG-like [Leguminivora glycinivorella]|uniref:3-oxoacyl-[acyl-carrier-protein] reductase FabG-like n=1 Tax=Leguminivora glycinivorella TaxID=1035111 RepID=UPI00200DC873|nr:3-oxoacyl-[acyl-carrier-protein] reductase FabG-like [Leguminivora glycinivorella]